jgi:hypothetical protein
MSAISSHRIRILGSGGSRPRGRPPAKLAAPRSFDSLWQTAVEFISLAAIGAIFAYLISMN